MIKGGIGGANTNKNGLPFEARTDISTSLTKAGWELIDTHIDKKIKKIDTDEYDVYVLQKHQLYTYLTDAIEEFDYKEHLSKKLLPDNVIINTATGKILIIEVKFQETAGSVDEKLQTCDFKKKQYEKLTKELGYKIEYIYILSDWFKKSEYKDVLKYIKDVGCEYYFNELPIEKIFN